MNFLKQDEKQHLNISVLFDFIYSKFILENIESHEDSSDIGKKWESNAGIVPEFPSFAVNMEISA